MRTHTLTGAEAHSRTGAFLHSRDSLVILDCQLFGVTNVSQPSSVTTSLYNAFWRISTGVCGTVLADEGEEVVFADFADMEGFARAGVTIRGAPSA